jgi:hypothetical protein
MDDRNEIVVDGHRVFCKITQQRTGTYTVSIATAPDSAPKPAASVAWRPAATHEFGCKEDAERHARYVLLGVCAVKQDGEPVLSVT